MNQGIFDREPAAQASDGFDELRNVLLLHKRKYPLMDIQDAAKVIYQHEFGCAHISRDIGAAYSALVSEYNSVRQQELPLLEDIGGGYARADLRALDANGVTVDELFGWVCRTASQDGGSIERFVSELGLLSEPIMGFDSERVANFYAYYKNSGYSPIHHSARYVALYAPAYRVIKAEYAEGRQII